MKFIPIALLLAALLGKTTTAHPQDSAPTTVELFAMAQRLMPEFTGEHRYLLRESDRKRVAASAHLMDASLALLKKDPSALRWKCHTNILLGEDSRTRGLFDLSSAEFTRAGQALHKALVLEPNDPWSWYANGMISRRLGDPSAAIEHLERSIALSNRLKAELKGGELDAGAKYVRFKAQTWLAELHLDLFDFPNSRATFDALYLENGNNAWDRGFSELEVLLRARRFGEATAHLQALLTVEAYGSYPQIYEQLGYLRGLQGQRTEAIQQLDLAIARENRPSIYTRIWSYILSDGSEESEKDLAYFVKGAPSGTSAWDLALGRFVLGQVPVEDFLLLAKEEKERRLREAVHLDDLNCEVWFYVGRRYEMDQLGKQAADAYQKALRERPERFKWEWAYSRQRFATLARDPEALTPDPRPTEMGLRKMAERFDRASMLGAAPPPIPMPGDLIQFVNEAGQPQTCVIGVDPLPTFN